jgi:transcriptional regulator with XRE-family HTH domain
MSAAGKPKSPHRFEIDPKEVGRRIRALREQKTMTQLDLSKLVEKSRPAIAQWENGQAMPSLSDFNALAFFLNSTPQYLSYGVATTHADSARVPVMDYTTPVGAPVGEMSLDQTFVKNLHRGPKAALRAFHLPRADMMKDCPAGSVAIIDENDTHVIGAGEAYLIHHKVPAVAFVNEVPGKELMLAVRIGGEHFQTESDLPVIGRVVAVVRSML